MTPDLRYATVRELGGAIRNGTLTSRRLVESYLDRIRAYDRQGPRINAVPVLIDGSLDEADRLDAELRQGRDRGPLHGIPFVVKDSFSIAGATVASGSPAFATLIAQRDAFVVQLLREAGAIALGKTTMAPMAAGGMQRGLYGRSESPFNADYLSAAWFSGSSNGSGAALGAGFSAFALAEETLSSGRSPASNNRVVAYTPSRGLLSMRGNWPFLAVRDVVVPYARTVDDVLTVLDVMWRSDADTSGDLWRMQPWVELPTVEEVRPADLAVLRDTEALRGKRLAVPAQLIGAKDTPAGGFELDPEVAELWEAAVRDLVSLGAEVIVCDVPAFSHYEGWYERSEGPEKRGLVPHGFLAVEAEELVASGWDEFLRANGDPSFNALEQADGALVFPEHLRGFGDELNPLPRHDWQRIVDLARGGARASLDTPGLEQALRGIEQYRRETLDPWLEEQGVDLLVFPAATGVGPSTVDHDPQACREAWRPGVEHSTGGFTVRHLGLPTVTVPMGQMREKRMPVGVTFASTAYRDAEVLAAAYAFDELRDRRAEPLRTPLLSA